jgi:hypothetical protein
MKRKITIALLALGTLGGYASGFASLRCRSQSRREHFERHVAALCVNAAREADSAPPRGAAAARNEPSTGATGAAP